MNVNQYSIGERVNVYYNPNKPERACLVPGAYYGLGESIAGMFILFSFIGVFISIGFYFIFAVIFMLIWPFGF